MLICAYIYASYHNVSGTFKYKDELMKHLTCLLIALCLSHVVAQDEQHEPYNTDYVPGQIMIRFREKLQPEVDKRGRVQTGIDDLDALFESLELQKVEKMAHTPKDEPLAEKFGFDRTFLIQVAEDLDLQDICTLLAEQPDVEFAEPNYRFHLLEVESQSMETTEKVVRELGDSEKFSGIDTYRDLQWHLQNQGVFYPDGKTSRSATPGCDANIINAWKITKGSSTIKIALIDMGVDYDHPDLVGRIDTDNGNLFAPINDTHGHGTMMTGIIAANANNGIGVAGVDQKCRILPLNINTPATSSIAFAIVFAADHGARIINMSFSCDSKSDMVEDAVNYAYMKGCVLFAASGNKNQNLANYPAAYDNVIAVGAISPCCERKSTTSCDGDLRIEGTETQPWGSTYGSHIDFVTPGVYMATTDIRRLQNGYSAYTEYNVATDPGGDYVLNLFGTSFSSAIAAGVASLMLAVNPDLTPGQFRSIMTSAAVDIGAHGVDIETGHGRLDAVRAVTGALQQRITDTGTPPTQRGPWWDPNHSGSGLELWAGPGQGFTIRWLTYDESHKPIWYYASNPKGLVGPNQSVLTADLLELHYDVFQVKPINVGHVKMAFTGTSATLSWQLHGQIGTWNTRPFFTNILPTSYSGLWSSYDPTWSISVTNGLSNGTWVEGTYLYYKDAASNAPRWVFGVAPQAAEVNRVDLNATSGSCPYCPYQAIQSSSVGYLNHDFLSPTKRATINMSGSVNMARVRQEVNLQPLTP